MGKRAGEERLGGGYLQREKKHKEESHGALKQSGLAQHLVP